LNATSELAVQTNRIDTPVVLVIDSIASASQNMQAEAAFRVCVEVDCGGVGGRGVGVANVDELNGEGVRGARNHQFNGRLWNQPRRVPDDVGERFNDRHDQQTQRRLVPWVRLSQTASLLEARA